MQVTWAYRWRGKYKERTGDIVAVVPPNTPATNLVGGFSDSHNLGCMRLYLKDGTPKVREVESYLVVSGMIGKQPVLYWPRLRKQKARN